MNKKRSIHTPKKTNYKSSRVAPRHFDGIYLRGWKDLSNYLGYTPRAIKVWHYEKARVPFTRLGTNIRDRWVITPYKVDKWLKTLGKTL